MARLGLRASIDFTQFCRVQIHCFVRLSQTNAPSSCTNPALVADADLLLTSRPCCACLTFQEYVLHSQIHTNRVNPPAESYASVVQHVGQIFAHNVESLTALNERSETGSETKQVGSEMNGRRRS